MSRYINADLLKSNFRERFKTLPIRVEVNTIVNEQPTADVVEVVRCKYCKHKRYDAPPGYYFCNLDGHIIKADLTGFCSNGEREKEVEND